MGAAPPSKVLRASLQLMPQNVAFLKGDILWLMSVLDVPGAYRYREAVIIIDIDPVPHPHFAPALFFRQTRRPKGI